MERVYREKKEFVEALNRALKMVPSVEGVEYKRIAGRYTEIVKITWVGGGYEYINVTGDSLSAICAEIGVAIGGRIPVGFMPTLKHAQAIDKWWNETK